MPDEPKESFQDFAALHFADDAAPRFCKDGAEGALLKQTSARDKQVVISLQRTIRRFMENEKDNCPSVKLGQQLPFPGSVMSRLQRHLEANDLVGQGNRPIPGSKLSKGTLSRFKASISQRLRTTTLRNAALFEDLPFEDTLRSDLDYIHFIIGHGVLRSSLRDEVYCYICKQLVENQNEGSCDRGWLLLQLVTSIYPPSEQLQEAFLNFVDSAPSIYVVNIKRNLIRCMTVGERFQPPSFVELDAIKKLQLLSVEVTLPDEQREDVNIDASTTAHELCVKIADTYDLKERFGFSIFICSGGQVASLGSGSDRIMDAVSRCEQMHPGSPEDADWKLYFRKEIFSPWEQPEGDTVASNFIYSQIVRGMLLGEYEVKDEVSLVALAVQQYYIEYGLEIGENAVRAMLSSCIPAAMLKDEAMIFKLTRSIIKMHRKTYAARESRVSPNAAKQKVVRYAKETWSMNFSRYFDVQRLDEIDWPEELCLALNWKGIFISHAGSPIYSLPYAEITEISNAAGRSFEHGHSKIDGNTVVVITPVGTAALTLHCVDSADLLMLLQFMLNGLRSRSCYAVAVHTDSKYGLREGDLLVLEEPANDKVQHSAMATNQRTKQRQRVEYEKMYILPILQAPSQKQLEKFSI